MGKFVKAGNVDVAAVCDIYGAQIDAAKQIAPNAKSFSDHRKLLDMKEVDAVLIGVPDHWHAAVAIDALNAGQGRVRGEAADAEDRGRPAHRQGRARQQPHLPGGHAAALRQALPGSQAQYMDTGKLGKVTLARTWWHGNSYHLRKAPASLKKQPSNLDWAHFLGPLKWRDWDPQQYWNWRAYLDFGGGQVTDLFTHWIDVVHMFMGQDIPIAASASGGVYTTRTAAPRPTPSTCCWNIPAEFTATFEATLVPGITGAALEFCGTLGRLWIDRSRYEFHPVGRECAGTVVQSRGPTWTRTTFRTSWTA